MRQLLFICMPILLLSHSCRKSAKPEYYFQCKVAGQTYMPNDCANCMVAKLLGDTTLLVNGNRGYESIAIGIIKLDKKPVSVTTYSLNDSPQQSAFYKNSPVFNDTYKTDSAHTGFLVISTLDKTNGVIAGTFQFTAFNNSQNKTIVVTSGEFRLLYSTN
jgi:hypothetical protein